LREECRRCVELLCSTWTGDNEADLMEPLDFICDSPKWDLKNYPGFTWYVNVVRPQIGRVFRENMEQGSVRSFEQEAPEQPFSKMFVAFFGQFQYAFDTPGKADFGQWRWFVNWLADNY